MIAAGVVSARLVLAAVFLVAGAAKLRDPAGSRQALVQFGVPRALAAPLGLVVPLAELAVAVALLPRVSAWFGALGSLVLLLAFIVGISVNLARGKTPDCHCFGQLRSEPVGWATLVRNGVLALLAVLVLARGPSHPGPSAVAWARHLSAAQSIVLVAGVVGLALLAVQAWMILHLLRRNGRLLLRLDALESGSQNASTARAAPPGLAVGTRAPAFDLPDLAGRNISLDALRDMGKPVVLVFTDPGCGPCNSLLPEVGEWQKTHADTVTVALISRGAVEENEARAAEHGVATVLLQEDREVAISYEAHATPSAVVVRRDGAIGTAVAAGADAIRAVVADAPEPPGVPSLVVHKSNGANGRVPQPARTVGHGAPTIRLPDLDGSTVDLADFRGRDTVVLFWNPDCGFCRGMLSQLTAWEDDRPNGAPELIVVSTGTAEANREQGIRAPLLLDQGFGTGQAFGANGTPMAVLVNAEGKIASNVAAGAPAVLGLLHHDAAAAA